MCRPCPEGHYHDPTAAAGTPCRECPPGTYNSLPGQVRCMACPAGTHSDQHGSVQCHHHHHHHQQQQQQHDGIDDGEQHQYGGGQYEYHQYDDSDGSDPFEYLHHHHHHHHWQHLDGPSPSHNSYHHQYSSPMPIVLVDQGEACPGGLYRLSPWSDECAAQCEGELAISETADGESVCTCPEGKVHSMQEPERVCLEPCEGDLLHDADDKCVCPHGLVPYYRDRTKCVRANPGMLMHVLEDKGDACPDELVLSRRNDTNCLEPCEGDLQLDENEEKCVCPDGLVLSRHNDTNCLEPCEGDLQHNADGECVCPHGWPPSDNICRPPPPLHVSQVNSTTTDVAITIRWVAAGCTDDAATAATILSDGGDPGLRPSRCGRMNYTIEYFLSGGGDDTEPGHHPANVTDYLACCQGDEETGELQKTTAGLVPNTAYLVTVTATDVESGRASERSSGSPAFTRPSQPSHLQQVLPESNGTSVLLAWKMDKGGDFYSDLLYELEYTRADAPELAATVSADEDDDGDGGVGRRLSFSDSSSDPSVFLLDLEANTNYSVSLTAWNELDSVSSLIGVTTAPAQPSPASRVDSRTTATSITVQWSMDMGGRAFIDLEYEVEVMDGDEMVDYITEFTHENDGLEATSGAVLESNTNYTVIVTALSHGGALRSQVSEAATMFTAPAQPANVTQVFRDSTAESITIEWTMDKGGSAVDELQYTVQYHEDGDDASESEPVPVRSDGTYAVSGLSPNTNYSVSVTASNGLNSAPSDPVVVTTAPATPDSVRQIANDSTDSAIAIEWYSPPGGSAYEVFDFIVRYQDPVSDPDPTNDVVWTEEFRFSAGDVQRITSSLKFSPNSKYRASVMASNGVNSLFSAPVDVWTRPSAPSPPSVTVVNSTTVQVHWDGLEGNVEYVLYDGSDPVRNLSVVEAMPVVVSGFAPGRSYTFRLGAESTHTESPVRKSELSESCIVNLPPQHPSGGNVRSTADSIEVEWHPVVNAKYYNVSLDGKPSVSTEETSYIFSGLASGRAYNIMVAAVSHEDVVSDEPLEFLSVETIAPAPLGVRIDSSTTHTTAVVSWTPPSLPKENPSSIHFEISVNDVPVSNTTQSSIELVELAAGTEYSVSVTTVNSGGRSNSTGARFATRPRGLSFYIEKTQSSTESLVVFWNEPVFDLSTFKRRYSLSYAPVGHSGELEKSEPVTVIDMNSANLKNLRPGTLYGLKLSVDLGTEGDGYFGKDTVTDEINFYTNPDPPSNIQQTNETDKSFTITWGEPTSANDPKVKFHYNVTYAPTTDAESALSFVVKAPEATIENASPGTSYHVSVTAIVADHPDIMSLPTSDVARTVPAAPSDLTITEIGNSSFVAQWAVSENGDLEITAFVFSGSEIPGMPSPAGGDRSATFTGLIPSQRYNLEIAAVNKRGQSARGRYDTVETRPSPVERIDQISVSDGVDPRYNIRLSWSEPPAGDIGIGGYEIIMYRMAGGEGEVVAKADATAQEHTVGPLIAGTEYEFSMVTIDGSQSRSDRSSVLVAYTAAATVPDVPPESVSATAAEDGRYSILVAWQRISPDKDGGSPVTGYTVRYTNLGDGSDASMTVNGADTLQTVLHGLVAGTTYGIEVAANNSQGAGPYSTSVNATTDLPTIPDDPPTDVHLVGAPGRHALTISWTAPAPEHSGGRDIEQYIVQWQESTAAAAEAPRNRSTGSVETQFTLDGLDPGTTYDIAVAAVNAVGPGPWSHIKQMTTAPAQAPQSPHKARVASVGYNTLEVVWEQPVDDGGAEVTHYTVLWRETATAHNEEYPNSVNVTAGSSSSGGGGPTVTIGSLRAGTPYDIAIVAHNSVGLSPAASLPAQSTLPAVPPAAPTGLQVTDETRTTATLRWNAPSFVGGSPVTHYMAFATEHKAAPPSSRQHPLQQQQQQQECDLPAPGTLAAVVNMTDAADTSVTIEGLTIGTTYTVSVFAVNIAGCSNSPATAQARTLDPEQPSRPTGLAAQTVATDAIELVWKSPADDGGTPITHYSILYSSSNDQQDDEEEQQQHQPQITKGAATAHTLSGLQPSTSYTISVVAHNSAGKSSPASDTISVETESLPPSDGGSPGLIVGLAVTGSLIGVAVVVGIVVVVAVVAALLVRKFRRPKHGIRAHDGGLGTFYGTDMIELDELMAV